jgi:AcrR family transcriptional regulator
LSALVTKAGRAEMTEKFSSNDSGDQAPSVRRRSARTQQAILDATVEVLAEVGYQDLSIERIATRAGVGKATIYRWWDAKSALVVEALQSRTSLAEVVRTGNARSDLRAAIRAVGEAHVANLVGATLPALASSVLEGSPEAERLRRFLGPRRDTARQVLHHAAADGLLPADVDIELIIDICVGTIFYRKLIGGHSMDEAVVECLASLILDGHVPRLAQAPRASATPTHALHGRPAKGGPGWRTLR